LTYDLAGSRDLKDEQRLYPFGYTTVYKVIYPRPDRKLLCAVQEEFSFNSAHSVRLPTHDGYGIGIAHYSWIAHDHGNSLGVPRGKKGGKNVG
jgi:hypothetical protein